MLKNKNINPEIEIVNFDPTAQAPSLDDALSFQARHFDYFWFSGNNSVRAKEKQSFILGNEYAPHYDYPLLRDHFTGGYDDTDGINDAFDEMRRIKDAQAVIYKHRDELAPEAVALYDDMFEVLYGRELLVETAYRATTSSGADARNMWREKFMEVNTRLYGEVDYELLAGIMETERQMIEGFVPSTEADEEIKSYLLKYFQAAEKTEFQEVAVVSQDLIDSYLPLIKQKYREILSALPDSESDIVYSSAETAEIINKTLAAGGLQEKGWRAVVDKKASSVSTDTASKTIKIPIHDTRTAKQLPALVLHEQEVHARRGENGLRSRYPGLLASGTASYGDTEEGLGIIMECIINGGAEGNVAVERARDRYLVVGLALGTYDGIKKDAREVYEIAWRLKAVALATRFGDSITEEIIKEAKSGKWGALTHVENIFRGTDFAGKGVIYTKAKVYLEGLLANVSKLKEIKADGGIFDKLFIGKYNHADKKEEDMILKIA